MFDIRVNEEYRLQVRVSFDEMVDINKYCLYHCVDAIESVAKEFNNIDMDCIQEIQDYDYIIDCSTEEEALAVEEFLTPIFEDIEENYC